MKQLLTLSLASIALLIAGCVTDNVRAKGGSSKHVAASGATTEIQQSENPKQPTISETSSKIQEQLSIPPGTAVRIATTVVDPKTKLPTTNWTEFTVAGPAPGTYTRTSEDISNIRQGGAWEDVVGTTIAKLKAAKGVTWFGVALILIGAAMFTPWVRPIIGSSTTPIITMAAGVAVVALPFLIIGSEKFIIVVIAVPLLWWIAHRHGEHKRAAEVYKEFIDVNQNGIDDREESTL